MTGFSASEMPRLLQKYFRLGKTVCLRLVDRTHDHLLTARLRALTPQWRQSFPSSAWPRFNPQDLTSVPDVPDPAQYFLPLEPPASMRAVLRAKSPADAVLVLCSGAHLDLQHAPQASVYVVVSIDGHLTVPVATRSQNIRVLHVDRPHAGQYLALLNSVGSVYVAGKAPIDRFESWLLGAKMAGVPRRDGQDDVALLGEAVHAPGYGGGSWGVASRRTRLRAVRALEATDGPSSPLQVGSTQAAAVTSVSERRRILLAGHDLKFSTHIVSELERAGHEVLVDEWQGHNRHVADQSRSLLARADVVWCEWALGNAVWYSREASEETRVLTRFHLQEVTTSFPRHINVGTGDRHVVFVGEHVRREAVRRFGWADQVTSTVPNAITVPPQVVPGDPWKLGVVGVTPARKGLAVALDALEALRATDSRYSLHLKGYKPTEYPWFRERSTEQTYFQSQYQRIENSPLLRGAVHWDGFSRDVEPWYADMGIVLSTSDFESFHFTLPDGAVRGAVPRAIAWPGSDLLYPTDWLAADVAGLAELILPLREPATHAAALAEASAYCRSSFGSDTVQKFIETLLGVRG